MPVYPIICDVHPITPRRKILARIEQLRGGSILDLKSIPCTNHTLSPSERECKSNICSPTSGDYGTPNYKIMVTKQLIKQINIYEVNTDQLEN